MWGPEFKAQYCKEKMGARGEAQEVESLPSKFEPLSSNSSAAKQKKVTT
jgi:hypothetical protein